MAVAAKPSNDVVALRAARCTARMATSLPQQSPGSTDWLAGRLGTIDSFQTSIRHADAKTTTLLTALAGLAASWPATCTLSAMQLNRERGR